MTSFLSEGIFVRRFDKEPAMPAQTGRFDVDILDEHYFRRMLCCERKRAERSGKPFMLIALSCNELFLSPGASSTIRQMAHAVAASTREIDTLGWYEHGRVLAVLFTEISPSESNASRIKGKVLAALQQALSTEEFTAIKATIHIFPDESQGPPNGKGRSSIFYPQTSEKKEPRRGSRLLKRSVDLTGSLLFLVVLFPVLVVIAILVRVTSDGPVLFRQMRIGQFGLPFTFYKFRSMYSNNDPKIHREYVTRLIEGQGSPKQSGVAQPEVYKLTDDPRVTPLGKLLRRASLDELPQLFNVLFGHMSLVGPRPPLPYEYERYQTWHRRRVFEVKPGITGLWQVIGRSKTTFDEMVRLDLAYARNCSLWLDLKILLKTPAAVLSGDGAY